MADRLPTPKLRVRDLLSEVLAGVLARPVRAALTTLGTVLGVTALVATLGISKTAGNQIVGRFSELSATQVTVEADQFGSGGPADPENPSQQGALITWDVEDRLERLNGVAAAGGFGEANLGGDSIRSVPFRDPLAQTEFSMRVLGVTSGLLEAVRGELYAGRFFDGGSVERGDFTCVLGRRAAERLKLTRIDNQPAIFIGSDACTVIGIIRNVERERGLLDAVLIPAGLAEGRYNTSGPQKVVIDAELGAAGLVASQAAIALNPNGPERLRVSAPPDPAKAREGVESDVNSLFLVLGLVSLVVGAIGIANVTLVTVLERVGEIGLRRALGAARRHIAAQFLLESTGMGFVGGVIGSSIGTIVTVATAAARDWTPVLDWWIPIVAPAIGAATGLLAGLYPSVKAARLEPVDALRTGV
jgi:putative ABC transport system permease protein